MCQNAQATRHGVSSYQPNAFTIVYVFLNGDVNQSWLMNYSWILVNSRIINKAELHGCVYEPGYHNTERQKAKRKPWRKKEPNSLKPLRCSHPVITYIITRIIYIYIFKMTINNRDLADLLGHPVP